MPASAITSLRRREAAPSVAILLALSQIHRNPVDAEARGPTIAQEYAASEQLRLYGYEQNGSIIGLIGFEPTCDHRAIIRDLAVSPDARRRGIGRALIDYLRRDLGFVSIEGDTLEPAIAFYQRCGFDVREGGTLPDGRTRYRISSNADRHP